MQITFAKSIKFVLKQYDKISETAQNMANLSFYTWNWERVICYSTYRVVTLCRLCFGSLKSVNSLKKQKAKGSPSLGALSCLDKTPISIIFFFHIIKKAKNRTAYFFPKAPTDICLNSLLSKFFFL